MEKDILLKVRNYGPLRQGTDSLEDGFLRVPKYTIFIGDQGTGKSTLAKLLSTFSWAEKSFVRRNNDPSTFTVDKLQTLFANQNLPMGYITENTELEFRGQVYTISVSRKKVKVLFRGDSSYVCPQIMYFPSERNILSVMDNPWEAKGLPEMVYQLATEYQNAMKRRGRRRFQLFDGYSMQFDPDTRTSYVLDPEGSVKIPLHEASSGLQSLAPLVVVSDYLAKEIGADFLDKLKRETISIRGEAIERMKDDALKAKVQTFFSSGLRDHLDCKDVEHLRTILGKYVNSCLWQVVEEPEQNLYPVSQMKMVDRLIENTGNGGKLVMTTHSPYVLSILNNYIFAFDRYRKFGKTVRGVSLNHMMDFDAVAAYKMQDGGITTIKDSQSRMIDATRIDECSQSINEVFDRLMDMGESPQ